MSITHHLLQSIRDEETLERNMEKRANCQLWELSPWAESALTHEDGRKGMRHGRPTIPQATECAQETGCSGWPDAAGWLLAEPWSLRAPSQPWSLEWDENHPGSLGACVLGWVAPISRPVRKIWVQAVKEMNPGSTGRGRGYWQKDRKEASSDVALSKLLLCGDLGARELGCSSTTSYSSWLEGYSQPHLLSRKNCSTHREQTSGCLCGGERGAIQGLGSGRHKTLCIRQAVGMYCVTHGI